ncbi:MAG: sigma-70 family RNA polymerase sigma factor [Actinomycetota bacterium]
MADRDAELLRALHDEHAAALWAYALRLVGGDRGRAEDVVQEALLRAWRHPQVLESGRGSPRAWLYTTARHIVIDQWRARTARPEVLSDHLPDRAGPDEAEVAVRGWLVAEALDRLQPAHREVLVECYFQGRSVAEVSRHLGVPEGTVKSRTHYALRALRLVLQEMGVTR